MKNIQPRLLPTDRVFSTARAHASQIVPILDRLGVGAFVIVFDDFCREHPAHWRNLPRLLDESFPPEAGSFDSRLYLPDQYWLFLRACDVEAVRAGTINVLYRTGLLRYARVFVAQSPRALAPCWPMPGDPLNFSDDADWKPYAAISSLPDAAVASESSRPTGRTVLRKRFSQLLHRLLVPLPPLKSSNGRAAFSRMANRPPTSNALAEGLSKNPSSI